MNDRDDLERRLEAWLAETARPMPPELFEQIVASAQRRPRPGVRAVLPSGGRWRLAAGAVAAVLVLALGLGVILRQPIEPGASGIPTAGIVPTPTAPAEPTPSAEPSPSPGPTPSSEPPTSEPQGLLEWHRNNNNAGVERLVCREGLSSWTCTYLIPEASGLFDGRNVTDSWTCPAWFPRTICRNVTGVYRGSFSLTLPLGQTQGPDSTVAQEYVLTEVRGEQVLQLYWVDRFVCPWYRTLDEALTAPFECTPAPGFSPSG